VMKGRQREILHDYIDLKIMTDGAGQVYCVGETVLDIIFRADQPVAAKPGGSMLNSAVSLARAGDAVNFISMLPGDRVGQLILRFLEENHVSTHYLATLPSGKTILALAFLDEHRDAEYVFYKDTVPVGFEFSMPEIHKGDIILFGSFFSLTGDVRPALIPFIRSAKSKGAFIMYDPNFRKPHLPDLERFRPAIIENIGLADLVRGSDEDFRLMFGTANAQEAFEVVSRSGCPLLVYTKNKDGAELLTRSGHFCVIPEPINPVSTIGAGDAFNAGIIHGLLRHPPEPADYDWPQVLQVALRFSEEVCMSLDNYISTSFGKSLRL